MDQSLDKLYQVIGISKQAFHQRLLRQRREQSYHYQLLFLVYKVRTDPPTMGVRDMYYLQGPECMGRDSFELFCRKYRLISEQSVNYRNTTEIQQVVRFSNLTTGLKLMCLPQRIKKESKENISWW